MTQARWARLLECVFYIDLEHCPQCGAEFKIIATIEEPAVIVKMERPASFSTEVRMLIVDSQVHIWGANTPERPWPAKHFPPHRPTPFLKDELLREMNAAGVDRVIIVPPSWQSYKNDLALEAAQLHPDRFAVMGRFDADAPDARSRITGWREQPGMLGIRLLIGNPSEPVPLVDGRQEWVWAEAEKAGIPLMMSLQQPASHYIDPIAARHPKLKLTVDHLGVANGQKGGQAFAELDKLLHLARHPNVAVKVSALPSAATDAYPFRSLHPHLRRVYDAFGPKRMFWGTDLTRLPCPYRQAVTMFTEEIPWLSAQDKEWIMGRGLCEWLGWPQ